MQRKNLLSPATAARAMLLLAVVMAGCSPRQEARIETAAENLEAASQRAVQKAEEAVTENSITAKVKSAMISSGRLDASNIDVDTRNKTVYLRGAVPNAQQKTLAESIAKNQVASGVKVVNQLQVRTRTTRPAKKTP